MKFIKVSKKNYKQFKDSDRVDIILTSDENSKLLRNLDSGKSVAIKKGKIDGDYVHLWYFIRTDSGSLKVDFRSIFPEEQELGTFDIDFGNNNYKLSMHVDDYTYRKGVDPLTTFEDISADFKINIDINLNYKKETYQDVSGKVIQEGDQVAFISSGKILDIGTIESVTPKTVLIKFGRDHIRRTFQQICKI